MVKVSRVFKLKSFSLECDPTYYNDVKYEDSVVYYNMNYEVLIASGSPLNFAQI